MALLMSHTNNDARSASSSRTPLVLIIYVALIWFLLVLSGSLLETFPNIPPGYYLTIGGPVVLFTVSYLLSRAFRSFVYGLVGDPFSITILQVYRVLGVAMAIQALRHALPALFGLPAGFGDLFIGVTAPFAAASWSSGTRSGKVVFVLWNVLGLLDLVIAVSTGLLAAFNQTGPITMAPMRLYPLSLVPADGFLAD